ncbi:translation initiation factor IF-2-like [Onychostruthus taczanowskii]|uniref:translation initiation factor IF-2-like n=1 Tax=Onychostruthus taczanowskii TaxID=356909 RepID=UPI001B8002FD|nr:translation initiation factor IF-2-like [Onychostruthus taczanowskii]
MTLNHFEEAVPPVPYAWPVLSTGSSTRAKLAEESPEQHPRLPYPQTWDHPYSLALPALQNRDTQKRKDSLFSLISGFYRRTCKSFHAEIKQNRTGREGVPGQEPRFAPRAWAAAAAPRRYRRDGATAAARSPPGRPHPSAPRAAAKMAEGPRPAAPALTCQPQPRRRAGRGRAAGGAEKEEGKDEDNEEEKAGGAAAEAAAAAAMIAAPLGQDAPPRCRALAATSGGSGAAPAPSRDGDGLATGQPPARHGPRARNAPAAGRASRPARPAGSERPGHRESLPPGTARGLGTPRAQGEPRGLGSAAGPGGSCPATTAPLGPAAPRVTAVPEVKQRGVFRAERAPREGLGDTDCGVFVCRRSDGGSASKLTTTFCNRLS